MELTRHRPVQEDAVESPDAICPCCGEALTIQIDVSNDASGALHVNSIVVVHQASPEGQRLEQRLDQLPKRKR